VDGRMDVPTDGHFRPPPMLLGRLKGVDLIIKYYTNLWVYFTNPGSPGIHLENSY